MPVCKLSKRAIDALPCPAERDTIWWDEDLKGFGLKRILDTIVPRGWLGRLLRNLGVGVSRPVSPCRRSAEPSQVHDRRIWACHAFSGPG